MNIIQTIYGTHYIKELIDNAAAYYDKNVFTSDGKRDKIAAWDFDNTPVDGIDKCAAIMLECDFVDFAVMLDFKNPTAYGERTKHLINLYDEDELFGGPIDLYSGNRSIEVSHIERCMAVWLNILKGYIENGGVNMTHAVVLTTLIMGDRISEFLRIAKNEKIYGIGLTPNVVCLNSMCEADICYMTQVYTEGIMFIVDHKIDETSAFKEYIELSKASEIFTHTKKYKDGEYK